MRGVLALLAATVAVLVCASQALASNFFTPGDVVVERDGNGGAEALTSSATPVYLNEFEPVGGLAATLALPTTANGSNKPLLDSGKATSDGELTLSENAQCVVMFGYDAPVGTENITESKDTTDPRTVALINEKGEINTTTALTNVATEGNTRGATSQECKKIWTGSNGKKSTGGVNYAEVTKAGTSTAIELNENDTNVRAVEAVDGQLYVSADPEQAGALTIAKVGSGLPTTKGQTITNLPFEAGMAPEEPYGFSLLTLSPLGGSTPDTLYVADLKRSEVVKYGLSAGKWVEHGAVEIPAELTGVTANDVGGAVTIYATSSGSKGTSGTLYRISDVSGVNGTLSGIPVEIAKAPANEAFRGVAFAPGTKIGAGGTPPPAPTISAAENALPAALDDPTNPTLPITVADSGYPASELTVSVSSSKESVAPVSGITVTGTGSERTLHVTPAAVGVSKLTLTVEAPDGVFTSTQISYGVSEYEGSPSDRYYSGAADSGSSIDVGGGYMIVAGDEANTLALYHERVSGPSVKTFNFNGELPYGAKEINIHSMARAGNTLYVVGSLDNTNGGVVEPAHDTIFAATITGSGANTELTYLGSYLGLKEDLVEWDNANGAQLGLAASAAPGQPGERVNGFKVQGVEFAPGSSTEAYLSFRAPEEPDCTAEQETEGKCTRDLALVIPVTNFSSLFGGNPETSTHATFGAPLEWNLGGLSIRQIRKNAAGEYVIIASTANSSDTIYQLWGWDGEAEDEPVLLNTSIPLVVEGVWDSLTSVPEPIANGGEVEVLQDDSKVVWYGPGTKSAEKGLTTGLQKSLGRLITVEIPPPGTPNPPYLSHGATPNKGQFTLRWKPAPTLRARFTLQHQSALGGWSTVASGLSKREYSFTAGSPEAEGTWAYRVTESNESGESGYSEESQPIKVDRTAPYTPTATAQRPPDYVADGGWYKNSVTVSFTSNGDPLLADGSSPSGVDPATLAEPQTFETSGTHTACGTVADNVGNVSAPGCLTVQVDATPPSLEVSCPAKAVVGEAGVTASLAASDAYSGLATPASETIPIETLTAGPKTVTRTAISNVGLETTKSCTTQVLYRTPSAPALTVGTSPNDTGLFTLGWSGDDPLDYFGLNYTLQAHDAATATWSTAASGLEALSYDFGLGEEEGEGTWVYRVQAAAPPGGEPSEYSPASAPVVVDKTPPYAPTASASRAPDYAGGGGWYKNSVEVKFTSNGDPSLSDGSPPSGVNPATLAEPQTLETSGAHTACGTVADFAGNVSAPGCLTVQVDATPPSLEISCPATAVEGSTASATFTASDKYSGLASAASGSVPIDTSTPGEATVSTTAASNVGLQTTRSCATRVESSTPGAPALTVGTSPNRDGLFTLGWTGPSPLGYFGLTYTLQQQNAAPGAKWTTVAIGLEALSYEFGASEEEREGTWVYRVRASDPSVGLAGEYSPASAPVVVDKTPPYVPTASPSRAPDYAGGGGWYKNSAEVKFTSNGDPSLSDGSPGSGVDPASISGSQTFSTSGLHTACGTVADYAGNVSAPGCLTVQVDATPPSLEISCPATAVEGRSAYATFSASDGYSGLANEASGAVRVNTDQAGLVTTSHTAISNVGLETTKSCTTEVGFTKIVTGTLTRKLVVGAGESVELTSTASASKGVAVENGGVLDIEGASVSKLTAGKAALLRICAASISSSVKAESSGPVVIGEGTAKCAASTISKTLTLTGNTGVVSVDGNVFGASVKVTGNGGGTTVTNNKVAGSLTVTGNSGTVVDRPNEVKGRSKLQ
jgi:hypothetical protein